MGLCDVPSKIRKPNTTTSDQLLLTQNTLFDSDLEER